MRACPCLQASLLITSSQCRLEENKQLCDFISNQKQAWDDDIEFVRKFYSQIIQSTIYSDYMASEDASYEADREVWRKLYKSFIMENEDIDGVLEEKKSLLERR